MNYSNQSSMKSFRMTQTKFTKLLQEYQGYGFKKADIIEAWSKCGENQNQFHDVLISLINQNDYIKKEQIQTKLKLKDDQIDKKYLTSKMRLKSNEELKFFESQTLLEQLNEQNLNSQYRTPIGLMNLGNTCYINIMIQFIYNIVPFRQLIYKIHLENLTQNDENFHGTRLIQQLKELFALMQSSNRTFLSPQELIETLAEVTPTTMLQGEQNDYSELLILFLDVVEKAILNLNDQETTKEFYSLFYGQSEENLIVDGQVIKSTPTQFQSISLELNEDNLQLAFQKSRILYIDDYEGPDKTKTNAIIHQNIKSAPKILQFYLNRVQFQQSSNQIVKSNQTFHFDSSIDINQLMLENSTLQSREMKELLLQEQEILNNIKHCGDETLDIQFDGLINCFQNNELEKIIQGNKQQTMNFQQIKSQLTLFKEIIQQKRNNLQTDYQQIKYKKQQLAESRKNIYQLSAVLMHSGDAFSGHYYCYIFDGTNWWKFNDRIVNQVDYPHVYKDATGQINQCSNVSGLIYEHQDIIQFKKSFALPLELQNYVNDKNAELLTQIDKQFVLSRKAIIVQRAQQHRILYNYSHIYNSFIKYQSFSEYLKNHTNLIYYLRNKYLEQDLRYCQSQLKLPENLRVYIDYMKKQSGLIPLNYDQLFKKEENQFIYINNLLANLQINPEISYQSHLINLVQFQKYCSQFQQIDESLYKSFQIFFQAILLMGCFYCDLLIQKGRYSVVSSIISYLIEMNKKSTHINTYVTQQLHSNLKHILGQLEQLKQKFLNDAQSQIQQPSIVVPNIVQQTNTMKHIDLTDFLKKIAYLEKRLEVWIGFVGEITIKQQLIPQKRRLEVEMPLYFNEKLF